MPRLVKLKSLPTFLAIKRCHRTKIGEVINLARSLLKVAHMCAIRGKAINQIDSGSESFISQCTVMISCSIDLSTHPFAYERHGRVVH
jgi:hypothetical protein